MSTITSNENGCKYYVFVAEQNFDEGIYVTLLTLQYFSTVFLSNIEIKLKLLNCHTKIPNTLQRSNFHFILFVNCMFYFFSLYDCIMMIHVCPFRLFRLCVCISVFCCQFRKKYIYHFPLYIILSETRDSEHKLK